jgi:chorismate lyase/3-hydroxybenzoate synthase
MTASMAINDSSVFIHPAAPAAAAAEAPLGLLCFGDPRAVHAQDCPTAVAIDMPVLAGKLTCEVWRGQGASSAGSRGTLHYRHDAEWLFGVISLDEAAYSAAGLSALQQAAEAAYMQIFALQDALGYRCVHRFWNYMADINGVSGGLERYRQFNVGRQQAFLACERQVAGQLPAACALGYARGPLTVAFLAGRTPSTALENPRQLSAFHYPAQYGPRSPTFARASLLQRDGRHLLLISGTASIVGHETLHRDDPAAQARESLTNVATVIDAANRRLERTAFDLGHGHYRVYVRHAAQLGEIRQTLQSAGLPPDTPFVAADICRADLLLEIEATLPEFSASAQ